jgi:hypothetical protein
LILVPFRKPPKTAGLALSLMVNSASPVHRIGGRQLVEPVLIFSRWNVSSGRVVGRRAADHRRSSVDLVLDHVVADGVAGCGGEAPLE